MTTPDPLALSRDAFTLEQAARVVCEVPLSRKYPHRPTDWTQELRDERGKVDAWRLDLERDASTLGVTATHHPAQRNIRQNPLTGEHYQAGGRAAWTKYGEVTRAALVEWCKAKGLRPSALFPPDGQPDIAPAGASEMNAYPPELAAAIEAFHAVRNDTHALSGTSPKQALCTWLDTNKPELSKKAQERIATVANWQPFGGAPKTPTGGT